MAPYAHDTLVEAFPVISYVLTKVIEVLTLSYIHVQLSYSSEAVARIFEVVHELSCTCVYSTCNWQLSLNIEVCMHIHYTNLSSSHAYSSATVFTLTHPSLLLPSSSRKWRQATCKIRLTNMAMY